MSTDDIMPKAALIEALTELVVAIPEEIAGQLAIALIRSVDLKGKVRCGDWMERVMRWYPEAGVYLGAVWTRGQEIYEKQHAAWVVNIHIPREEKLRLERN